MTDITTVGTVLVGLRDRLLGRPALSGVQVITADQGIDTADEALVLVRVEWDQTDAALGRKRIEENYTVHGGTWVVAPGSSEGQAVAARERAIEIVGELQRELSENANLDGAVNMARLRSGALDQGVNNDGRWCQISFSIDVQAYIIPE